MKNGGRVHGPGMRLDVVFKVEAQTIAVSTSLAAMLETSIDDGRASHTCHCLLHGQGSICVNPISSGTTDPTV